jgi:hypothetical protein
MNMREGERPMSENRRQVLEMLAAGQITADEAERLIAALEKEAPSPSPSESTPKARPKYLHVLVEEASGKDGPTHVDVRVPMQLLRAGVRLASVIPAQARDRVNVALGAKGIAFDLNEIKPGNLEEVIDQLNDLSVDVTEREKKVRVFCE